MPTLTANWINIKNNHDRSLAFDWGEAKTGPKEKARKSNKLIIAAVSIKSDSAGREMEVLLKDHDAMCSK